MKTSILDRFGRPARATQPRAQYDATFPSKTRSGIWTPLVDGETAHDQRTRHELARLAWHLWENSCLAAGMIERFIAYVVGNGLFAAAASEDTDWNTEADQFWRSACEAIELTQGLSFYEYIDVAARSAAVAGDALTVMVDTGKETKLHLIEQHLVSSAPNFARDVTLTNRDGLVVDSLGRVVAYQVQGYKTAIPERDAVLHWFPRRPGARRGVSILATAINSVRDVEDIVALEKIAVKEASGTLNVVSTASGELLDEDAVAEDQTLSDGETVRTFYERRFGAEAKILRTGDTYQAIKHERPGPAWQGLMEFLASCVGYSTGMPPSVLVGGKVGGADTRKELATARRIIERWQQRLGRQCTRIWRRFVENAANDKIIPPLPVGWDRVEWLFPRTITADAGREAREDREDLKAGMGTLRDHFGAAQQSWKAALRQRAEEQRFIHELAEEFELEPEDIAQRYPNPPPEPAEEPAEEPGGKPEPKE